MRTDGPAATTWRMRHEDPRRLAVPLTALTAALATADAAAPAKPVAKAALQRVTLVAQKAPATSGVIMGERNTRPTFSVVMGERNAQPKSGVIMGERSPRAIIILGGRAPMPAKPAVKKPVPASVRK